MKYDIESIKNRKQNMTNFKRIIDIILVVLIYNIVLVAISCMDKIEKVNIFGYQAYTIKTNSMVPEINPGDAILIKKVDENKLQIGDVITFVKEEKNITHRIVNIETNDKIEYTTKGDNNNLEDEEKIVYEDIEGKLVITIPYLGNIMGFLENKIVFLIIVLVFLILYFFKIQIEEKKDYRREKKKIEEKKSYEN